MNNVIQMNVVDNNLKAKVDVVISSILFLAYLMDK